MDLLPLSTLNFLCAVGGLALLFVTIGLFADYIFNQSALYIKWVAAFVWPIICVVTIGSVVLSLIYSEYFGFVPCSLCWLQRIALYPQALIALMAFRMKETQHFPLYGIGLSVGGLMVAVYHYIYQLLPKETLAAGLMPCLADGSSDCATLVMNEFGFVTFPLLSAITFVFLIMIYLNLRRTG